MYDAIRVSTAQLWLNYTLKFFWIVGWRLDVTVLKLTLVGILRTELEVYHTVYAPWRLVWILNLLHSLALTNALNFISFFHRWVCVVLWLYQQDRVGPVRIFEDFIDILFNNGQQRLRYFCFRSVILSGLVNLFYVCTVVHDFKVLNRVIIMTSMLHGILLFGYVYHASRAALQGLITHALIRWDLGCFGRHSKFFHAVHALIFLYYRGWKGRIAIFQRVMCYVGTFVYHNFLIFSLGSLRSLVVFCRMHIHVDLIALNYGH